MDNSAPLRTSLGESTADTITVAGHDLASELMGSVSLSELSFLLVTRRIPTANETRLFDAVLVALCDHGLTPIALAARLTYLGAPQSVQGAMAAGLLGVGDRYLGVVEDTALMLQAALADADADPSDEALAAVAQRIVDDARAAGRYVPGLGHGVHKQGDPRTARLYEIAEETTLLGPHLRLLKHIGDYANEAYGKYLPINGAGASGAALADLGLDPAIARGFAVMSRAAGLVGHIAEEQRDPIGHDILKLVRSNTDTSGAAESNSR